MTTVDPGLVRRQRQAVLQRRGRSQLAIDAWLASGKAMPIETYLSWNKEELITQILRAEFPEAS